EEFWLFEKMDDERRQKKGYRSRLIEDHEVPDWAYSKPGNPKDMRGKGFDYETANLSGKRRRKEVKYDDTYIKSLSPSQDAWYLHKNLPWRK
ncbi:probable ATP-dependent DNA helicase CHR12, partial [Tanacetum coccineum]